MNPTSHQRGRVVVIDDDAALSEVVSELLTDEGYEVVVHPRWHDGHQLVAEQRPSVVLLDLNFGVGEDGWRLLDRLMLDPATRAIPVILWSAAVDSLRAHQPAILPGYGHYTIGKPFDIATLLSTVAQAVSEHPLTVRFAESVGTSRSATGS